MDGWYSRFNARGELLSGSKGIWFKGVRVGVEPDLQPQPYMLDVLLVKGSENGSNPDDRDKAFLLDLRTGERAVQFGGTRASSFAAGGGKMLATNSTRIGVAVSRAGQRAWIVERNGDNNDHAVYVEDIEVMRGSCHAVRTEDGFTVWSQLAQPGREETRHTWGWRAGAAPRRVGVFPGKQLNPVPIATPAGDWVLYMTDVDLRLHPAGESMGFIIPTGENQNFGPDAIWLNGGIEVVWNDASGGQHRQRFTLGQARVDCSKPLGGAVAVCGRQYLETDRAGLCEACGHPKSVHAILREEAPVSFEPALIPDDVQQTIRAFAAKFPPPTGASGEEHEERCRDWMLRLGQQLEASYPGAGYGRKRAGATRPWSKDGLPRKVGAVLHNWDLLAGAGTGQPVLNNLVGYRSIDISDQVFEAVSPVNHLGASGGGQTDATHRYQGGGNDTGTCDVAGCGKSRQEAVHAVPEGQVQGHEPWQGEDGIGPCDLCGREVGDAFHEKADTGGGGGTGGGELAGRVAQLEHGHRIQDEELNTLRHETAVFDTRQAEAAAKLEQAQTAIAALRSDLGQLTRAHTNTVAVAHDGAQKADTALALAEMTKDAAEAKFKEIEQQIANLPTGGGGGVSEARVRELVREEIGKAVVGLVFAGKE
jgi:hypothetical protein